MKKILFIDRDGTLITEPEDEQVDSFSKLKFYPRSLYYMAKIAIELDFELVMVTNQDGLGTDSHPEANFWPIHNLVLDTFAGEGVVFSEIIIDKTFAHENAPTRKPNIGLLQHFLTGEYDLAGSFVIGDRINDVVLAKNLGAKAIWLRNNDTLGSAEMLDKAETLTSVIALQTQNWVDIYTFLSAGSRQFHHIRKTNETDIEIDLNLDGTGKAKIETGLNFFNHMLDQIARHGGVDLNIIAKGDLHIDEHHTVEDTGIALGEAFAKAIGNKLGLERYGFCLPMDDCLAQVAIDFGGRNWIVWDAEFKREKVGDVPTEMFYHFFKSFSDQQNVTQYKAEGAMSIIKLNLFLRLSRKQLKWQSKEMQKS